MFDEPWSQRVVRLQLDLVVDLDLLSKRSALGEQRLMDPFDGSLRLAGVLRCYSKLQVGVFEHRLLCDRHDRFLLVALQVARSSTGFETKRLNLGNSIFRNFLRLKLNTHRDSGQDVDRGQDDRRVARSIAHEPEVDLYRRVSVLDFSMLSLLAFG